MFASSRLPLIEAYAASLADAGVVRGLIGPREAPRLWERHLLNCAVLGDAIPENMSVCDIGSGAGLPGLVLAIARPDLQITLVEPLLRRTTYLNEVVEALALENVEVVRGRADALHGRRTFDVVTSRAVAPLGRLLEWSMPLVSAEGALVAMKGSSVEDEIVEAAPVLAKLGCTPPETVVLGEGLVDPLTYAVRVAWAGLPTVRLDAPAGGGSKRSRRQARRGS
ncbi:16S rRNA (guanine(527)-N(7))-methyltransferase RsmG [Nocardioides sp. Root140]|uniref:16S rRNA (guanine(527)-N(7))-methyltransferase RsmG n=1 Tax=Nocardioides sp. Root140 TaxID=1736460 RepID=UPI0006FAA686|nr:16S rRNA (guanine(527)-N(7))-methyltransferase RsmG [Nocardioides sp. Root140]KQY57427.1 16S rRNA (guanine(527)-N(7))-methyltransferase RsmG [Nocardioides sp. Root140]